MTKTKVGIIGTVGVPAAYGGFETLAHQLVLNLAYQLELTVYSSSKTYKKADRVATWKGANIKYIPLKANGIQSIPYDIISMIHAMIYCEVLLILGVSGCIFLPFVKLFTNKKVIVNVDGLEWRRAKWSGWIKQFLVFSEKMAADYADIIVTDNAALQDYIAKEYGIESSLIEYGADHVSRIPLQEVSSLEYPFINKDYAFKVCRIEPENNIHLVLAAFADLKQLPLVVVGNWKQSEYGLKLVEKYANVSHLHLLDPIYDQTVLNALRSNCKLYVHGHSAGGTNPSLVEAMYLGLPIFAFDVIYNKVTTEHRGLYFSTINELKVLLVSLTSYDLHRNSIEMLAIAKRRYTWAHIANKYKVAFTETVIEQTLELEEIPSV